MALLEIRKKSATTWVHIKGGITTILSNGLFRIENDNFELSEISGIDQFSQEDRQTAITDIRLYDDTVGGSVEHFTDAVVFTDRLKALNYPFFKASASGNSVWGLLTGNITDQTDLINYINENSGSTTAQTNPVENEYADIAELLSGQVDQTENFFQYVEDASVDSGVTENTDSDFPFEAYYEKLTGSTASLTDYRLLNSSEVTVLQGSNSYRTFRISGLNDDTTPLTSVTNGRIGVDYNTVTDKVTSVLFDKQFTKVIQNIVGLSGVNDYKFKFYNQNTRRIEVSTITSFTNVGQYQRANLDSTINSTDLSQNHRIEVFFDIDSASIGVGSSRTFGGEITVDLTLSTVHKGLKWFRVIGDVVITVPKDLLDSDDNPIFFKKNYADTIEFVNGSGFTLRGNRTVENRYFIKDTYGGVALIDCSATESGIIGNLRTGYTGPVTVTSWGTITPNTTGDVPIVGSGFSDNMRVTIIGNGTLNSINVTNENVGSLNITTTGLEGEFLGVIIDNGDVATFVDAIEIASNAVPSIVIKTNSTASNFSPQTVNNSGATLKWTVTGGASGIYDANDPTIDLSANTGEAIITVTSDDDLAGLTTCRFNTLSLTALDITDWHACTDLLVFGNPGLSEIIGLSSIQSAAKFDVRANGLTTLGSGVFPNVTELAAGSNNNWVSLDLSVSFPNLEIANVGAVTLSSLNISGLTSLTSFICNSYQGNSFVGLNTCSALVTLTATSGQFTSLDLSGSPLIKTITIQAGQLTTTAINNVILDLDSHGLNNGTLNYALNANDPTATESTSNDVLNAYNSLIAKGWSITGTIPS